MVHNNDKNDFNPSGVGLKNGNFIGLPFTEETAKIILVPVPWDVTVSFGEGTALAPLTILDASTQLDLFDPDVKDAWKLGIFWRQEDQHILEERNVLRPKAAHYIQFIEDGKSLDSNEIIKDLLNEINKKCEVVNSRIFQLTKKLLQQNKLVGLIGGDHSVPLGYLKALAEIHSEFGVLQIDAHHDLRSGYEGFTFSHASIFYNALKFDNISKLVQVGIRDYCEEEVLMVEKEKDRITVFYDHYLKEMKYAGESWKSQCEAIISELPEKVYISFDIDGLDPKLCPKTGTPVPGGLDFSETVYLLIKLVDSGRTIIGFDLCETGNNEWDANVAARILYKLSNLMCKSNDMIR
jgi:agmatinase